MLQLSWIRWKCISMSQYLVMNIRKKSQHVSMVSRSEYPPYFGLKKRVHDSSFVACQADDPGM